MRKTVGLPFLALALGALAAVGCSGGNYAQTATGGGTPTPFPSPSAACTAPAGTTSIQEVFPQNNAGITAGIPAAPNLQGIVIAVAPNPLPTGWFFYYGYNNAFSYPGTLGQPFSTPPPSSAPNPTVSATPTASPLPTPSDTPTFANPIYESASAGIFANSATSAQTFTIYLANAACYPGIKLNTFTTATYDLPSPTPTPTSTPT